MTQIDNRVAPTYLSEVFSEVSPKISSVFSAMDKSLCLVLASDPKL